MDINTQETWENYREGLRDARINFFRRNLLQVKEILNKLHEECKEEKEFTLRTDEYGNELTLTFKSEGEEQIDKIFLNLSKVINIEKNDHIKDLKILSLNDNFFHIGSKFWFMFNQESLYVYGINYEREDKEIAIFFEQIEVVLNDDFLDYLIFALVSVFS